MSRLIISFAALFCFSGAAMSQQSDITTSFSGYKSGSSLHVMYDDVDAFLNTSLYVVGPSSCEKVPRPTGPTGALLKP